MNFEISDQNVIIPNPAPPTLSHHPRTSLSRIAFENRYVTLPSPIFNSYLFNRIKIVPIYAHESSKPITFVKRRTEYLNIALFARFSKIMFFK